MLQPNPENARLGRLIVHAVPTGMSIPYVHGACINLPALLFTTKVSAEDKASGKVQNITITSEKGRLSEEEIERMVKEADTFAEQDRRDR